MKANDNNQDSVRLTEVGRTESPDTVVSSQDRFKKIRKPIIFGLMAVVFAACMCMIFVPASDKKDSEQLGLNEAVPQATDAGMQEDKGKAYESEMMEQNELDRKKSLSALSDYWNMDSTVSKSTSERSLPKDGVSAKDHQNQALNSYRNIQGTLSNFYDDKGETTQLQNEVRSLKSQLAQKESSAGNNPVENQLALMEKSYQMAAKYFPTTGNTIKPEHKENLNGKDSTGKTALNVSFSALYPAENEIVSALYREPSDSIWLANLNSRKNRNFYTAGKPKETLQAGNSIRACIHENQVITAGSTVRIRILAPAKIEKLVIPKGIVLTGVAKFQGTRLQLQISSVEFKGSIIPVDIAVYDVDGQMGLAVPITAERSAITETIANMGNTSGTSISLSSSTGQQVTSDLSKSIVQGISGYFSKKVRTPKVTLKAGYQVFLVTKK